MRGAPTGVPADSPSTPDPDRPPLGKAVHALLRLGLDVGGNERLVVNPFGGGVVTFAPGQLASVSAGLTYQSAAPFALEATFGYKADSASASNGTVEFTRLPLDFLVSLTLGHTRLGVGATMHFNPSVKCDVAGVCAGEVAFDDALGFLVQFAHTFPFSSTHGIDLGARYTSIEYAVSEGQMAPVSKFDGSSVGFFVGVRL